MLVVVSVSCESIILLLTDFKEIINEQAVEGEAISSEKRHQEASVSRQGSGENL